MKRLNFEDDFTVLREERKLPGLPVTVSKNQPDQDSDYVFGLDQTVTVSKIPSVTVSEIPGVRSPGNLREAVKRELRKQERAREIYVYKKLLSKKKKFTLPSTIDEILMELEKILKSKWNRDRKIEEIRERVKQWEAQIKIQRNNES
jgi:hypothetical protein